MLPAGFVASLTDETNLLADDSPEPFLFLPATGWRDATSIVSSVGRAALYWASNFGNTDNATHFTINSGSITPGDNVFNRANGAAVRCVRD